jgi:predicted transcriptional regulator
MQTSKSRHQFYLSDELSARLDAMSAKPGASKTAILTDALTTWLERRAAHELDDRFGTRLDNHSRSADRIERKLDYLAEALGLFVRHQLTLTAHQPAFDDETRRLGGLRYEEFVRLVGRFVARNATAPPSVETEPRGHGHGQGS